MQFYISNWPLGAEDAEVIHAPIPASASCRAPSIYGAFVSSTRAVSGKPPCRMFCRNDAPAVSVGRALACLIPGMCVELPWLQAAEPARAVDVYRCHSFLKVTFVNRSSARPSCSPGVFRRRVAWKQWEGIAWYSYCIFDFP